MGHPVTEKTTRLYGIVASGSRTAVVFRRGPSKQVRLIQWDLAHDLITAGQWLSGRVYNGRCGLSPDGKLLVYFAGKFKTKIPTFTALSRPPYFTALVLWPDSGTRGGGGFFEGNRKLILNYGRVIDELNGHKNVPPDFTISHVAEYKQRRGVNMTPESNQGWILKERGSAGEPGPDSSMRVVFAKPWSPTCATRPSPTSGRPRRP